ncbi:MAG: hypothetical protein VYE22_36510 [Myxococcota bacterium]|nr:hypothetical protein [Myxococcota bacterium]
MRAIIVAIALVALPASALAQQFEEVDGYVVMEMESVPIPSGHEWERRTDIPAASGSHYIFTGNGICNGPAGSPLRYTFRVHTGGTYRLHLRAARTHHCVTGAPQANGRCSEHDRTCTSLSIPDGDRCPASDQCVRTDISNDAFVHVEEAGGGYVPFVGQPGGSVGDPIKLFGGGNQAWSWTGARALDIHGKHDADWVLEPGDYTLVIQGRSQLFRIDRLMFYDTARGSRGGGEDLAETRFTPPPPPEDAGPPPVEDAGPPPAVDAGTSPEPDAGPAATVDASTPTPTPVDAGPDGGGRPAALSGGCAASPGAPAPLLALLSLLPLLRRRR